MRLWMLWLFALCMASAVLAFARVGNATTLASPVFMGTAVVFVVGLLVEGIRRPVV